MKALRILVGVIIAVIVLVAILAAVALTPAVQTWAVRKAVAGQPGLTLTVGHVAAGPSHAVLDQVHLVRNGMVVDATRVTADYSVMDYLTQRRVIVHDLTTDGLVVKLPPPATAANTAEKSPPTPGDSEAEAPRDTAPETRGDASPGKAFNGVLGQIPVPVDFAVDRFSVPGRAELPDGRSVVFSATGSNLGTGRRGTVDWKADVSDPRPSAAAQAVHASGTVTVHVTTERRVDLVETNAIAGAEGSRLPADQLKLVARAEQPAAGGDEGYDAVVSLVHLETTEPLLHLAGHFDASKHTILGVWNATANSEALAQILAGFGLPGLQAAGDGKFSAQPDQGALAASGQLQLDVNHPERLSPDLAATGPIRANLQFDANLANNVAHVAQLLATLETRDGKNLARIEALQQIGFNLTTKRAELDRPGTDLARITIDALPLAWAQPFLPNLAIKSGTASLILSVSAAADGSEVRISAPQPVTLRNVTVQQAGKPLVEGLQLAVTPHAEYAHDALTAELNNLTVTTRAGDALRGRITTNATNLSRQPDIAFSTDTEATVASATSGVPANVGPVTVSTQSEGRLAGTQLHFEKSTTRLLRAGQPLATVSLVQPLTLDTTTRNVTVANAGADAIQIELGRLPLALAQPFVANAQLAGEVSGGKIGVRLGQLPNATATTTEPISLHNVSVTMNGRPLLRDVDVRADFTAGKEGDAITYEVRRLDATQGQTPLVSLNVAGQATLAGKVSLTAKGALDANATALVQQPVAAGSGLTRGRVHAEFDAKITDTIAANATVTASDLTAQGNRPLGDAVLQLTAAVQSDGSSVLKVPFTLTNGDRKSDVTLNGKVARSGNALQFDGQITSSKLYLEDLAPLAALAPSSPTPSTAPSARPAAAGATPAAPAPGGAAPGSSAARGAAPTAPAPAQAFWSVATGKVDVNLKEVVYAHGDAMTDVHGGATLDPQRLTAQLGGQLQQQPFTIDAHIDFAPTQPQPYTSQAKLDIRGLDIGHLLAAANPKQPPQLETKVNVAADLTGHGTGPADLAKNTYGVFDVTGGPGVLRALGPKRGGNIVGTASALAGLAGALTGHDNLTAGADLAGKLAQLPFDRFSMHVERGPDLNLKITNLQFLSPEMHLVGSGAVQAENGVPVSRQPMQITLQLGAKGNLAYLLQKQNLLSQKQDEQGFQVMSKTFTIKGTPSNPDSGDLWSILLGQINPGDAVQGLEKLLGR